MEAPQDPLHLYGRRFSSRLLLGTAQYPSPQQLREAALASGAEILTVSLRRQAPHSGGGNEYWRYIRELGKTLLPNTAGCHTVQEAVALAQMSRELFETSWIKLEVIGDDYNLQPDPFGLAEAAEILVREGFQVFPYCTDDLMLCRRLLDAGCEVIMPWGSPIGAGRGILNPEQLQSLRHRLPAAVIIVDAGIGRPSHAAQAMELGCDAVLLNTAVAQANHPPAMAAAMADAVRAGRAAHQAGLMPPRQLASPSTPTVGAPFWHEMERG